MKLSKLVEDINHLYEVAISKKIETSNIVFRGYIYRNDKTIGYLYIYTNIDNIFSKSFLEIELCIDGNTYIEKLSEIEKKASKENFNNCECKIKRPIWLGVISE